MGDALMKKVDNTILGKLGMSLGGGGKDLSTL